VTEITSSSVAATLTLRVVEARPEDIGYAVARLATLLTIAEYRNGTRVAPFVILRNDFLVVLNSERGSPKPSKK